ncbi:MAG: hypothetical protein V9E90_01465 [Saprospiraceae bacterium]
MSNQGSFLGWPPAAGGGGGSDYPFSIANAKVRRWRITSAKTIPGGAMVVSAINRGIADATVKVGSGPVELMGPGMGYNFEAQQNTFDKTMELSTQTIFTPAAGQDMEIYVVYPQSSATDPNSL